MALRLIALMVCTKGYKGKGCRGEMENGFANIRVNRRKPSANGSFLRSTVYIYSTCGSVAKTIPFHPWKKKQQQQRHF